MRANLLPFRIMKLLVVLNCEVLSFNLLFNFFSLVVPNSRLDEALINLFWIDRSFGYFQATWFIKSVLEFVAQVVRSPIFVDSMEHIRVKVTVLRTIVSNVVKWCPLILCSLLFGSFLSSMPKSYRQNFIFVWRICSSWIFIIQRSIIIFFVDFFSMVHLVLSIDLIRSILSQFTNLISGGFHKPMDTFV